MEDDWHQGDQNHFHEVLEVVEEIGLGLVVMDLFGWSVRLWTKKEGLEC
jgi:hypothetical protein